MKITHENNIEVYRFRNISLTHSWADIYIDLDERESKSGGSLFIRSDFGSWDYYWGHTSKSFKHFLTEIGNDYLIHKLAGSEREFRLDEWDADARRIIKQCLPDVHPEDENYVQVMEELESLECEHAFKSSEAIVAFMHGEYPNLFKVFCDAETFPEGDFIPRQLEMFVEQVWPTFAAELKKEIEVSQS